MKFNTKLEKSRYNSAIDRINSNIDYALKKGLEFTDYHQDFQNKAVRYGVVLTPTGKISKKSNLTPAQLKELERTSKVAGRKQKKFLKNQTSHRPNLKNWKEPLKWPGGFKRNTVLRKMPKRLSRYRNFLILR